MNFKKKMKIRLLLGIGYIFLGLAMIIIFFAIKRENDFLSSFGFAIALIGVVRVRNYFIVTKSEERMQKQEILENDERNISIANKAKSVSFTLYMITACIAIIVLQLLDQTQMVRVLSTAVCILLILYWISYWIIRKKS